MTLSHSPAPWLVTHGDAGEKLAITAADGTEVVGGCGCCGSPYLGAENFKPDAALIGAAPEMLAFLKRLYCAGDWYMSAIELYRGEDGEALETELIALVAKAEGNT